MDVLTLLKSKNRCLENFLLLSRAFLLEAEQGKFEGLTSFETRREASLKAMNLFDRKISETVPQLDASRRTQDLIDAVKAALDEKDRLVREILDIDLKIIGRIEDEKNSLLRELTSMQKSKESVGKFKSTWVQPSGDELDAKL